MVELVVSFKLKDLNPGVCVHYHKNIVDLLMHRNNRSLFCSSVSAMAGDIFRSSLGVLKCIMAGVRKRFAGGARMLLP